MEAADALPRAHQALAAWHPFYALLGGASATMVGLLFVAVSVGGSVFSALLKRRN
jgi:hypothetical protein